MFVEINGSLRNISLAVTSIEKGVRKIISDEGDSVDVYTLTYYINSGTKLVEDFLTKEDRDKKYNSINALGGEVLHG